MIKQIEIRMTEEEAAKMMNLTLERFQALLKEKGKILADIKDVKEEISMTDDFEGEVDLMLDLSGLLSFRISVFKDNF